MLRALITIVHAIGVVAILSGPAHAQSSVPAKPGFELLLPTGTINPTGAPEEELTRATLAALQLSYGLRPDVVLTGTVGWGRARPVGRGTNARLDMFIYDVGAELRQPRRTGDGRFNVKPFTGIGVGARSYDYRDPDAATTHNLAAYVSAGGDIALAKVRLRLEMRDYITWTNPSGASGNVRYNDVAFTVGLRLAVR